VACWPALSIGAYLFRDRCQRGRWRSYGVGLLKVIRTVVVSAMMVASPLQQEPAAACRPRNYGPTQLRTTHHGQRTTYRGTGEGWTA
jgi:hypothetical protein